MNSGDFVFSIFGIIWVLIFFGLIYLFKSSRKKKLDAIKLENIEQKLDKIIELLEQDKKE